VQDSQNCMWIWWSSAQNTNFVSP